MLTEQAAQKWGIKVRWNEVLISIWYPILALFLPPHVNEKTD